MLFILLLQLLFLKMKRSQILVGIIMGSQSDWPIMKHASDTLTNLAIKHEKKVVSAHRTPDLLFEYAESACERGIEVIIAGAGGAAHLPGMTAAKTHIPVIGVPIKTKSLEGKEFITIYLTDASWYSGSYSCNRKSRIHKCRFTSRFYTQHKIS